MSRAGSRTSTSCGIIPLAHFLERLAAFSRVVLFDKRGTGLSDRVSPHELPTLEQRMDDVRALMDAVGLGRAVLFGHSEGGPMCIMFAATYPQRTNSLILYGTYAKRQDPDDDYPWVPTAGDRRAVIERIQGTWGTDEFARAILETMARPLSPIPCSGGGCRLTIGVARAPRRRRR